LSFTVPLPWSIVAGAVAATHAHTRHEDTGFPFPDRRHSSYSGVYPGVLRRSPRACVRACVCACVANTHKKELDTRFPFPDRRHTSYSEVKPGVDILSPLDFLSTITPCSQKCIQSLPARLVAGNCFQVELHCLTIPPNRYSMNRNR
jgi:hypothetical protein